MKHPNDMTIFKLSFKKRIHKNMSFRKLHVIYYSWKCSEFFVSFFANSNNMSIKFKACVHYFYQISIFSSNDSPLKTMKNIFYST